MLRGGPQANVSKKWIFDYGQLGVVAMTNFGPLEAHLLMLSKFLWTILTHTSEEGYEGRGNGNFKVHLTYGAELKSPEYEGTLDPVTKIAPQALKHRDFGQLFRSLKKL